MKHYLIVLVLFFSGLAQAWVCPDLSHGVPDDLWDYQVYRGQVTGHDTFKKISVATPGVACLYNDDDPFQGLVLIRYGRYYPLHPEAEYWHFTGGGTSGMYCTIDRELCSYH